MNRLPNAALTMTLSGALTMIVAGFMDRPLMAATGLLMWLTGTLGFCLMDAARRIEHAIRESAVHLELRDIQISNVEKGPAVRIYRNDDTTEDA